MLRSRPLLVSVASLVLAAACRHVAEPQNFLGAAEAVAPGIDLYRSADVSLVAGAGPIAVSMLRLDPDRVRLTSALSNGEVMSLETVEDIAKRLGAIAAVNGGYFNRDNGEPIGLLKVAGELVSDSGAPRGAVVIETPAAGP